MTAQDVLPGLVTPDVARALPQAFARRQRSDYDDFTEVRGDEVRVLRDHVTQLVAACEAASHGAAEAQDDT